MSKRVLIYCAIICIMNMNFLFMPRNPGESVVKICWQYSKENVIGLIIVRGQ